MIVIRVVNGLDRPEDLSEEDVHNSFDPPEEPSEGDDDEEQTAAYIVWAGVASGGRGAGPDWQMWVIEE